MVKLGRETKRETETEKPSDMCLYCRVRRTGWSLVPKGGMEVPGPREEMLGQKPESVLDELWQTFFGK